MWVIQSGCQLGGAMFWLSGMVAKRAASRAAPSALRFAAASSCRWACMCWRCALAGSGLLVGRDRAPLPPPSPRALVLGVSSVGGPVVCSAVV